MADENRMQDIFEEGRAMNDYFKEKANEKTMNIADLTNTERRLVGIKDDDSPELILLRKWMHWFLTAPEAPRKMPNALHIETIVFIIEHDEAKFHKEGK